MEEKNQQNHLNNPVVVILVLALVGLGGYFLFSKNSNTLPNQVSENTTPNSQQAEIDTLKKQIEEIKNTIDITL